MSDHKDRRRKMMNIEALDRLTEAALDAESVAALRMVVLSVVGILRDEIASNDD